MASCATVLTTIQTTKLIDYCNYIILLICFILLML